MADGHTQYHNSPLPLLRLQISELQGEALKREKEVRAKGQQQQKEHLAEVESLQVCLGACPHMYVRKHDCTQRYRVSTV